MALFDPAPAICGHRGCGRGVVQGHVENTLDRIGVIRALEEAGFEPGDDVEIAGTVFELHPGT